MTPDERPNGILPLIQGQVIGAGALQLPPAGPDQRTEISLELDAGQPYRMVRVRFRLMKHKKGKSIHWFWTAVHAEQTPPLPEVEQSGKSGHEVSDR